LAKKRKDVLDAWMQKIKCNGKEKERCIGCLDANGKNVMAKKRKDVLDAWMQMVKCIGKEKERCIGCLDANGRM